MEHISVTCYTIGVAGTQLRRRWVYLRVSVVDFCICLAIFSCNICFRKYILSKFWSCPKLRDLMSYQLLSVGLFNQNWRDQSISSRRERCIALLPNSWPTDLGTHAGNYAYMQVPMLKRKTEQFTGSLENGASVPAAGGALHYCQTHGSKPQTQPCNTRICKYGSCPWTTDTI